MTIREYVLKLLEDTGCSKNAYRHVSVEQAVSDVQRYEEEHGKLDFPTEDVGKELVLICNNESLEPYTPPPILPEFEDCDYACKWGLTDLYSEYEEALRKAINSGERFDTGWISCAKEIRSMRIVRDDEILVECCSEMDSIFESSDLFCDFLTDAELEMLTDEMIDSVRETMMEPSFEYAEEVSYSDKLPSDATYEQVMKVVAKLEQECEDFLEQSFHQCIGATLCVMYPDMPTQEKMKMISDRIEEVDA